MSGRRVLTCLLCDNDVSVKKLLEHICGHIQYAPQKCGDCNFKSAEPSDLLQHTLDTGHVGNPSIDPYKELLLDSISKDIQFATEHGVEELVKKKKKKFVPNNVESLAGATVASNPEEAKKTTTEVKSEVKEEVKEEPRISGYDEGSVDQSGAHGRGDRPMPVTSTANNVNFNALNDDITNFGNGGIDERPSDEDDIVNFDFPGERGTIMDDRNSTPIEEESLNNMSSNEENADESAQTETIGEAKDSMDSSKKHSSKKRARVDRRDGDASPASSTGSPLRMTPPPPAPTIIGPIIPSSTSTPAAPVEKPAPLRITIANKASCEKGISMKFSCNRCSAEVLMNKSSKWKLEIHAMTHCAEKRFKCSECGYCTHRMFVMNGHMRSNHESATGEPIDRKNALRDALWNRVMHQCFPDVDDHVTAYRQKRTTSKHLKCNRCSRGILADDRDLFDHIINDHSGEVIDYDDPDGVKNKFFTLA